MSRRASYLALAGVFGVHNLEEGLSAARMLEIMTSRGPRMLQGFYATVTAGQLVTGLVLLTILGFVVAFAAHRRPSSPAPTFMILVFGAVIGLNAVGHIILAAWLGAFMPGLLTAVMLCLPVAGWLLWRAYQERWVSRQLGWAVAPAAVLVHGPVLFAFLRGVGTLYRVVRGVSA